MTKIRLFLKDTPIDHAKIKVQKDHLHYLKTVMRLGKSAEVLIFNGVDGQWLAKFEEGFFVPQEQILKQTKSQNIVTLCFAVPKTPALKNIIRQSTELGVDILQPIYTRYTENRLSKLDKIELWATEAAEQCGRITLPKIAEPIQFEEVFQRYENIFLCDEEKRVDNVNQIPNLPSYTIVIGPEGGFAPEERERNCTKISLGKNILRCDTAAACAISYFKMHIMQSESFLKV